MNGNGNFRIIETLDIGQHNHGAEIGRQVFQAVLDGMFEFGLIQAFFRGGMRVGQPAGRFDLLAILSFGFERGGGTAFFPAQLIVTCIGDRAQQPGTEGAAAVGIQGAEGGEEGLLDRIGSQVIVVEDAYGRIKHNILKGQYQGIEGLQVAVLGIQDES